MKLYIETRNKFFKISIIILLISLITILKFRINELGYFLLGIFASTLIIAIQSNMSAKVEESKLLIDILKKMRDLCYNFDKFNTFSVDFFALDFEKSFLEYKEKIETIFNLNSKLGNVSDLNNKTMKRLKPINERLIKLQLDLHFIFKEFENQSNKMKIIYFMEFYKIIKEFNFYEKFILVGDINVRIKRINYLLDLSLNEEQLGFTINDINNKIKNLEYETSMPVYNKRIEQNNAVEYKALKSEFEKYMKK